MKKIKTKLWASPYSGYFFKVSEFFTWNSDPPLLRSLTLRAVRGCCYQGHLAEWAPTKCPYPTVPSVLVGMGRFTEPSKRGSWRDAQGCRASAYPPRTTPNLLPSLMYIVLLHHECARSWVWLGNGGLLLEWWLSTLCPLHEITLWSVCVCVCAQVGRQPWASFPWCHLHYFWDRVSCWPGRNFLSFSSCRHDKVLW